MKDKYWASILIWIILLASLIILLDFITYRNAIEKHSKITYEEGYKVGYNNKICEIYEDNYDEGYNSCQQEYEEKINSCFEKCDDIVCIMVVGGCEDVHRACLWNCFHPDYGFAKID